MGLGSVAALMIQISMLHSRATSEMSLNLYDLMRSWRVWLFLFGLFILGFALTFARVRHAHQ